MQICRLFYTAFWNLLLFEFFTMQLCRLFFTTFGNFWRITRLSITNHRWVINAQTGPGFFGPPCRYRMECHARDIGLSARRQHL